MSPGLVVLLLAMLLGLQPVATDLYLPALPAMTQGFNAPVSQAQYTLSALLLAFGSSQLLWGPLSDRFGRRPILLLGLSAFVAASVGSTLAGSMESLIAWRTLQGAAMGAAVMCARAIVRDLYQPVDGARVMSKGLSGLGIIACASAPLGGLASDRLGWPAALMLIAIFGAVTLGMVVWRFEETLAQRNPQALSPSRVLPTWLGIARHPTFLAWALLATASYGGLFTFLAASSFVFIQVLGLTKPQYGLAMFSMSLSYIVGTFVCRWLLSRVGVRRTVALAGALSLIGGTLMGVLALAGVQSLWAILPPFYLFMVAHGVHQPCGQSGAVGPFPQSAGAASALSGFIMMVVAFAMGGWLGPALARAGDSVLPLTQGIWFWGVACAAVAWTLVQRHGEARPAPQRLVASGR